tara:strand:+ start:6411 stop:6743 length:333 start_codon:yes stop_codon:yes gene_type:complete
MSKANLIETTVVPEPVKVQRTFEVTLELSEKDISVLKGLYGRVGGNHSGPRGIICKILDKAEAVECIEKADIRITNGGLILGTKEDREQQETVYFWTGEDYDNTIRREAY